MAKFGERYELIRRVGAGGMAEVWLAHDEQLARRPVAIKIMHKHMLPNEDDVARFEREMRFAALMSHPNIVTVYTTGTCDGAPFLVMEYLRGHDLEKAPPGDDAELIAGIGRDICSGLAYAHREGVIHRDIKPANLFLCENGQVKITDFGVARAVGEALSTAVLVGTFAYMPPERWRGEPSAVSGDIWAAGCVLYRLISGRMPRLLPDVGHYAAAATRGEPVPDLRDITDVPDWLAGPVMAMLADDPAHRPTAAECVQALSTTWFTTPAHGLPASGRHVAGKFRRDLAELSPAGGAASEDPVTTPVARPASAHTAAGRSRRPNRTKAAIGGTALLLLAGSVTAWRLSTSPPVTGLAAGATPPAVNHAAAALAPAASPSRSGSAATSPPDPAPAAPAASGSGSAAGSSSSSPTGSRSTAPPSSPSSPSSSPAGSPDTAPASTPAADPSGTTSGPSTPPLVPVPDVTGMSFSQAQKLLQGDGFTVAGVRNQHGDKVVSTSPSDEAPEGSVITVVYGA